VKKRSLFGEWCAGVFVVDWMDFDDLLGEIYLTKGMVFPSLQNMIS